MNLEQFIEKFNSTNNKAKLIKDTLKTEYVSYGEKITQCERIVKHSMYQDGKFNISTPVRFLLFEITIVELYLGFEIDSDNYMKQFDLIAQSRLCDYMLELVPDIKVFQTVLKMMVDDCIANENNVLNYVNQKFNAIVPFFDKLLEGNNNEFNEI